MATRYWLIREDARSVSIDRQTKTIALTTTDRPRIQAGDQVLIMKGSLKTGLLLEYAEVSEVALPPKDEKGSATTTIHLGDLSQIQDTSEARLFTYTLTFIYNLRQPGRHFYRAYRLLPFEDFKSITQGELFVSRTAYYEFLNALPEDLQIAARFEESMWFLGHEEENRTFSLRLERLRDFIETRVLSVGRMLLELRITLGELDLRDRSGERLGHQVAPAEGRTSIGVAYGDDLAAQAQRFELLGETLRPLEDEGGNETNILQQAAIADGGGTRSDPNARFEQLFKGR